MLDNEFGLRSICHSLKLENVRKLKMSPKFPQPASEDDTKSDNFKCPENVGMSSEVK